MIPSKAALRKTEERFMKRVNGISPRLAAYIDWVEPWKRRGCGGPMNGQLGRQTLVRALLDNLSFEAVVETGTYRGTTTEFLLAASGKRVYSAEKERRFYYYAERRLAAQDKAILKLVDSRTFLSDLATDESVPKGRVFFYLDAHWENDLPLVDEILIIWSNWRDPVILIDDFEVPEDPGYDFDDYGVHGRICESLLPWDRLPGAAMLFPTLPSFKETGARRGFGLVTSRTCASELMASLPLRGSKDLTL